MGQSRRDPPYNWIELIDWPREIFLAQSFAVIISNVKDQFNPTCLLTEKTVRSGREVDEELAIVVPVVKTDLHIEQKTVGGVVRSQWPQGDRGQA